MADNDDKDEVPHLILQVYKHHRQIILYPTSRIVRANCGHLAWLSPQGEGLLATAYTLCTECYEASVYPDDRKENTVPGAVQALEELWGTETAEAVREELRQRGIKEE